MRPNPHATHGVCVKFGNSPAKLIAVSCDPSVARARAMDALRRAAAAGQTVGAANVIKLGSETEDGMPRAESNFTINGRAIVKDGPHLL